MRKLLQGRGSTSKSQAAASKSRGVPQPQVASSLPTAAIPSPVKFSQDNPPPPPPKPSTTVDVGPTFAPTAAAETELLRADVTRLQEENDALKGQVHLLKFKVRTRLHNLSVFAVHAQDTQSCSARDGTMPRPRPCLFVPLLCPDSSSPLPRWNCSSTWSRWRTWIVTS
jgi:hypothetical protein